MLSPQWNRSLPLALLLTAAGSGELRAQAPPAAPPDAVQPITPPSAKDGAVLFSKSGCTFCHGVEGRGTEKAPSLRDVRKRKSEDDIFHQIHDGGKMMPPFAEALSEGEIRSIVLFLHAPDGWSLLPKDTTAK